MSRLQEYQRKKFTRSILFALVVFIALLIFIFTLGLKILLNTSIFIARIGENKSNTPNLQKKSSLIGDIDIQEIPVATNSSTINVSGTVINFNRLEFYLNNDRVKESSITGSDAFSEEIENLSEGQNEIYILAKMGDSNEKKKSKTYTILYKKDKPSLDIREPQDGSKTTKQELQIKGSTDKEIYVKVNDLPVVVDAQGNFETSIRLKEGENKITIQAQDIAGNIEVKTLTITYQRED